MQAAELSHVNDKENLIQELSQDRNPNDTFFGQSPIETIHQYTRLKKIAENPRAMDVRKSLEGESINSIAAVAHVENALGINRQGSQIRESRQKEAKIYNQEHFEEVQETAKSDEYTQFYGTSDPASQARRAAYSK